MKMWHHDGDKLPGLGAIEVRPSASVPGTAPRTVQHV